MWEIIGGTGRFDGATGRLEDSAINPPQDPNEITWSFDWSFTGELNKANRGK